MTYQMIDNDTLLQLLEERGVLVRQPEAEMKRTTDGNPPDTGEWHLMHATPDGIKLWHKAIGYRFVSKVRTDESL